MISDQMILYDGNQGEEKMPHPDGDDENALIEVAGLHKRFGSVTAVDGISFNVRRGELFGFLGPNGAGKTTTITMLVGLARPDTGRITIAGLDCSADPKAAQHLIGVVPDESNLYPELSGYDNLCFCAALYGMSKQERCSRAAELLELFGLQEAAGRKFGGYSKGMKRKLTIAAGIIHHPQILFLDEPTTGIDLASARQIRQMIAQLHTSGTTIFLTTHYLEEAERLCERIAFIVKGRIVREDTVANLLATLDDQQLLRITAARMPDNLVGQLGSAFPGLSFQLLATDQVQVVSPGTIGVGPLVRFMEEQGAEVSEARRLMPSLEDVFVKVAGIGLADMGREKEKAGGGQ
jgi:ABC-2 type transport system ATP-binding protein